MPPAGWWCTRGAGHDGPCAAIPITPPCQNCGNMYHAIDALGREVMQLRAALADLTDSLQTEHDDYDLSDSSYAALERACAVLESFK